MNEKTNIQQCCPSPGNCRIESLITIDERGQMVLPKELREKAKLKAGDKLAVVTWEKDGEICCISLVRAETLSELVKDFLGPVISDIWK